MNDIVFIFLISYLIPIKAKFNLVWLAKFALTLIFINQFSQRPLIDTLIFKLNGIVCSLSPQMFLSRFEFPIISWAKSLELIDTWALRPRLQDPSIFISEFVRIGVDLIKNKIQLIILNWNGRIETNN